MGTATRSDEHALLGRVQDGGDDATTAPSVVTSGPPELPDWLPRRTG